MASDVEVLILIPAASHSVANCFSEICRSEDNEAKKTTFSANSRVGSWGHRTVNPQPSRNSAHNNYEPVGSPLSPVVCDLLLATCDTYQAPTHNYAQCAYRIT